MPRATHWSDLKIGIIAALSVLALAAGVLRFARIGALHGATTTIYVVSDAAGGVMQGTEVWLAGRKAGLVSEVRLQPVTMDTSERVLIKLDILSQYMGEIRKNSTARIRPGTSLIAEPVVAITTGTVNMPAVAEGDTLRALSPLAKHSASVDIASLGDSIVSVADAAKRLASTVRTTAMEPISRLRRRTEDQATAVKQAIDQFTARTSPQWRGTVELAARDTMLHRGVAHLQAEADSIQVLLSGPRSTLGRFRRDSTLGQEVHDLLATTEQFRTRVASSLNAHTHGDSALVRQLDGVHRQLDSLMANVIRHPLRYNPF